jgi:hypothetical protein
MWRSEVVPMRGRMMKTFAGFCLIFLAACSKRQLLEAEQPIWTVHAQLASMPSAADVMDLSVQPPGATYNLESAGNPLVWRFKIHGKDYCRFSVKLTEVGPDRTQVETWAESLEDAAHAAAQNLGSKPDYRFFCEIARIAGQESVAATIERRSADGEAIQKRIARNVATDPLSVAGASAAAMDEVIRMKRPYEPCAEDPQGEACRAWRYTREQSNQLGAQQPRPTAPAPTFPIEPAAATR